MLVEGEESNYSYTVAKRLLNNINDAGLSRLFPGDVKSVFFGDIPFGGGISGSSAKFISDFFILASVNNLLTDDEFVLLVTENGKKAAKTKEAMLKYNRLSEEAASSVEKLNEINQTGFKLLRYFFQDQPPGEKTDLAYEQLFPVRDGKRPARRAYQFFRETEITGQ